MNDPGIDSAADPVDPLTSFLDKWRARWPEWVIASVFVPVGERETALAWAALQQELIDAAWGGSDARPGEAKLAWWQEELQGWSLGRRRHPLGVVLQKQPAPWTALAATLPSLGASRERPRDIADAFSGLQPFGAAVARIDAVLAATAAGQEASHAPLVVASALQARFVQPGDSHVPLDVLARAGTTADPAALWRRQLLAAWPESAAAPRLRRLWASLARARLTQADPTVPLPPWRALPAAWRAARNGRQRPHN